MYISVDSSEQDYIVRLDLGLNFLLKKKNGFDKFIKIYGKCSKKLNTLKFWTPKIIAENNF